jgi:hypothetical protein
MKRKDITGQKFGRLTAIERVEDYVFPKSGCHLSKWRCKCECGKEVDVAISSLKNGNTKSCGCLQKELHRKTNPFEIHDDYVTMYTLNGNPFYVDLEDFEKVKDSCWHIRKTDGYVVRKYEKGQPSLMHDVIMNPKEGELVDHIHGSESRHDNRKYNLRIATVSQNNINKPMRTANTSGAVGVDWNKRRSKWRARISINNKEICLGYFENFNDAVEARKQAEEKYFGRWSYNNSQTQQNSKSKGEEEKTWGCYDAFKDCD